jgi:DNA adenine methylase
MAWPGGKDGAGVVQRLINQIPPHDVFISAFLGDCAIMRRKLPAAASIGVDADRANIERWYRDAELPGLKLYCCCGIEWLKHYFDLYRVDLVPSRNKRAVDRPTLNNAATAAAAENGGLPSRRFVYLDPPYLLQSRRSRKRLYKHEMTDDQHAELLDTAVQLPCLMMISHYPHQLYAHALRGWRTFTFAAQTRGGGSATEQVWCNYDQPAELHDARFVGGNKRQRERVRRRARNWVDGLARMEPAERQAVLDAIEGRWLSRPRQPDPATQINATPPAESQILGPLQSRVLKRPPRRPRKCASGARGNLPATAAASGG